MYVVNKCFKDRDMILKKKSSQYSESNDAVSSIQLSSGSELLDSLIRKSTAFTEKGIASSTTLNEQMPVVHLFKSCPLALSTAYSPPIFCENAVPVETHSHQTILVKQTHSEHLLAEKPEKTKQLVQTTQDKSARDCAVERLSHIISADRQSSEMTSSIEERITTPSVNGKTAA